jgi:hypothetical protein
MAAIAIHSFTNIGGIAPYMRVAVLAVKFNPVIPDPADNIVFVGHFSLLSTIRYFLIVRGIIRLIFPPSFVRGCGAIDRPC